LNSCCVEFEDGYKMITSRNALRRRYMGHEASLPATATLALSFGRSG
jgi:hypothetical protein